jgi:hypothetical protein
MKLLSLEENAQKLQRTTKALRNMVMRHQIPFRKVAGRLMFIEEEITAWIEKAPGYTLDDFLKKREKKK